MNYITDNAHNLSYDEYTYHVDMMLLADFGEPATFEQLRSIATAYEQGLDPQQAYSSIADMCHEDAYDDEWAIFDDLEHLAVA